MLRNNAEEEEEAEMKDYVERKSDVLFIHDDKHQEK